MEILGLSNSTPRTESRWRALLWPTIRDEGDFDYVTTQGFWICFTVAVMSLVLESLADSLVSAALDAAFYFLAALGVRQRSRVAAVTAFSAYLLSALVLQKYTGGGFGILRIIFLALLFANIRGNWLSARWAVDQSGSYAPMRLNQTLGDRLSDQLPAFLWPKSKYLFYVLAVVEIALLLIALVEPRPGLGPIQ